LFASEAFAFTLNGVLLKMQCPHEVDGEFLLKTGEI